MIRALDAAFIIGALLCVTKGADLLLLERQKKVIDVHFRRLHESIRDLNPSTWMRFLQKEWTELIFLGCVSLALVALAILNYWPLISYIWNKGPVEKGVIITAWASLAYGVRIAAFLNGIVSAPELLLETPSAVSFVLRDLAIAFCAALLLTLMSLLLYLSIRHSWVFTPALIVIVLMTPFLAYLFSCLFVSMPILALSATLVATSILIIIARWLGERILEYNKGVYAGLILIITVILSLCELWVKSK